MWMGKTHKSPRILNVMGASIGFLSHLAHHFVGVKGSVKGLVEDAYEEVCVGIMGSACS